MGHGGWAEGEMLLLLLQFYLPCFPFNLETCNKKELNNYFLGTEDIIHLMYGPEGNS